MKPRDDRYSSWQEVWIEISIRYIEVNNSKLSKGALCWIMAQKWGEGTKTFRKKQWKSSVTVQNI